ncbi:MAG: lysophospholipid acyltransferase family protein [Eubacterium sp.]
MIYTICKTLVHVINVLWFNFTITGKENIPEEGNYIICPNHVSIYDPVVIASQIKRQVHFMAKAELYENPFLKWLMLAVGTIPVDRHHVSMDTLRESLKVLKDGGILGIFPEGTRAKDGERLKPMDGFVVFALKTKSPIIPVHITGEYKFRGKINIKFGKSIELNECYGKKIKAEEISKISQKIMDNVYDIQ